jgi:PAS domain S-box-containing protein
MASSALSMFSSSERDYLKKLLKKPDKDFEEIISILETKVQENTRQFIELEEKYKSIIDGLTHVGIGIDIVSKDYRVLFQNQTLKERFGDSRGKKCYSSYLGLKNPCEFCPMEEALKYNRIERFELDTADGKSYELISAPYPNQDGTIDKVAEVVIDITDRKQAGKKLKESEEKYRYFIENSIEGVWVIDENANTVLVNPSMVKILGYSIEEMIGLSLFTFMDEASAELTRFHLEKRKRGISEERDAVMMRKNGEYVNLRIRATPIFNSEGIYEGTYAFLTDITEQKIAEERLKETERRLRSLIEQTTDAVFCYEFIPPIPVDLSIEEQVKLMYDCTLVECNLVCAKLYGAERVEDVLGRKLIDLFGTTPSSLDKLFRDMINGGYNIVDGIGIEKIPGSPDRYFLNNGHGVIENGKLIRIWGTFRDITERKLAEQKLKDTEERFKALFKGGPIPIYTWQKVGNSFKLIDFNNAADKLTPGNVEKFLGVSASDMYKERPDIITDLNRCFDEKSNIIREMIYTYRNSVEEKDLLVTYSYIPPDLVLAHTEDITERKQVQEELIKINQLKSELLRRTSHELKTPLVSIKGFTELLLQVHRDKLDALVISTLNEIKQGCLRLESLITDILKTAELESGATILDKKEEDISFLVKVCVNEIKGFSKLRNHTINLEIQDKMVTQFEKEQIHQVISNLLNNAVKYTPPSGTIEVKSEIRDDFIVISVRDNGIGFTEEEKTRIFKQFGKIERYGQGLDIIAEGSGFGLFISKKIIELHGGNIWIESEGRNKGSTFYFSLPIIKN